METMRDYRNRWRGETVTLVGGAVTTIDYQQLAREGTQRTLLINWALRIAPFWRGTGREVYFFSWHMYVFAQFPELLTPELTPCLWEGDLHHLQAEIRDRAVIYAGMNVRPWEAYLHLLEGYREHGQDWIDDGGFLPSCANTTLLALMFLWHAGVREVNAVGMHDIGGVPRPTYDPRLSATTGHVNSVAYTRDPDRFCEVMGMRLNYLGER